MTPEHLRDALGRDVALLPLPRRILSLVPSVTELLFDLGAGDRVAGRTDYCISPEGSCSIPSVGGPKTVDLEAVAALRVDLVLANAEENRREQVEALIARGFRVHVAFPRTIAEAAAFVRDVGALVERRTEAEAFAADLETSMASPPAPPVRCACLIWKHPYMTVSRETLTSALLAAAGAQNVFAERPERYPRIGLEELATARPEVVLLPSEPYAFGEADAAEIVGRVRGAAVLRIPGEWVTWYGSRMAASIRALRTALRPFRRAA